MHIDFSDCLHIPLVFQSSCLQFLRIVKLRGKFQGFLYWCGSYICWCYFGSEAERESNISILALSVCHWKWGPYFFGMMHVTWLTDKTHVLFSAIWGYQFVSSFLHLFYSDRCLQCDLPFELCLFLGNSNTWFLSGFLPNFLVNMEKNITCFAWSKMCRLMGVNWGCDVF